MRENDESCERMCYAGRVLILYSYKRVDTSNGGSSVRGRAGRYITSIYNLYPNTRSGVPLSKFTSFCPHLNEKISHSLITKHDDNVDDGSGEDEEEVILIRS